MMITKMMKISLFVLVGIVSGSSAQDSYCFPEQCTMCSNVADCYSHYPSCAWSGPPVWPFGQCIQIKPVASSFVSTEAVVGDEENDPDAAYEDDVDDTHSSSVSGDTRGNRSKKYLRTN